MMHQAAMLLGIRNDQLLGLLDITVTLPDLPANVTLLMAQVVGDLDPGEPRCLALADIEIHANSHDALPKVAGPWRGLPLPSPFLS